MVLPGTQTFVVVDGQEGPRYDALVPDSVRFSLIVSASPTARARARNGRSYSMGSPGNPTMALAPAAWSLARMGNALPMSPR